MSTLRVPLTQLIQSRKASTSKDSRSVNCYFESRDQNTKDNVKRPGLLNVPVTPAMTAGQAQGIYKCDSGDLFVAINNKFYIIDPSFTSTTAGTLTGPLQNVYFAESANDAYLFAHNGTNGYVAIGNGSFTQIPAGMIYNVLVTVGGINYFAPICTFDAPPAGGTLATGVVNVLGGVVQSITITNYGSGYVTTPACTITDTAGGSGAGALTSVVLNGFPAGTSALAAGAVYIDGYTVVATKTGVIYSSDPNYPMLWNPLNTVAVESDPDLLVGIVRHFNYIVAFGVWSTEYFYDAANATGSPFLRQDAYKSEIGCADGNSVVQYEQGVIFVGQSKSNGKTVYILSGNMTPVAVSDPYIEKYLNADTNTKIQSFVFKVSGHTIYIMTLPNLNLTFAYDLTQSIWTQWTSYVDGSEQQYMAWTATQFGQYSYALDDTLGLLYKIDVDTYTDNGSPIYWRVVTNNIDGGTRFRKYWKSGEVVGDKVAGTMYLTHCDNDYVTFSTARTVQLDSTRSIIWQLGQSRYRAFQFLNTDNIPLRLSYYEVQVTTGEQASDAEMQAAAQGAS